MKKKKFTYRIRKIGITRGNHVKYAVQKMDGNQVLQSFSLRPERIFFMMKEFKDKNVKEINLQEAKKEVKKFGQSQLDELYEDQIHAEINRIWDMTR